ncbi:MAG: hypothetical protein NZ901_08010 [Geminocystis sp.]|nr:hypothetical protein [Geminocystis sp.]HIK37990.1 hypothetical protein [Geminocystis sp. M7585_C2015_104]MCS7148117.1 hypothetical protein [Geminocystis sp.]MCX8077862.1 hypothetical protein [Geminocystis sp.]MDW8116468.1 hypothetical protein [Geminocystis sp.]
MAVSRHKEMVLRRGIIANGVFRTIAVGLSTVYLFLMTISSSTGGNSCPEEELYSGQKPSPTTRRVRLPEEGIEISVPSNYRVIKRSNGEVEVLHPADYALLRCVAEGRGYGRGYYSEIITLIPRKGNLTLLEQIKRDFPDEEVVDSYSRGVLSGYIIQSKVGLSLPGFIGAHPTRKDVLLVISASCDCDVEMQDFLETLSRLEVGVLK